MNPKLKLNNFFLGGVGGAGIDGWTDEQAQTNLPVTGEGARVSDFFHKESGERGQGRGLGLVIFFHKESKSKKKFRGVGGEAVWGRGRWMDRRTGPNQFAPSTSKLGA